MTVEEIYADVAAHMIEGLMIHEQLANYYDFLGLGGYKRCHEYHYIEESVKYRGLYRYFINQKNDSIILLQELQFLNTRLLHSNHNMNRLKQNTQNQFRREQGL